jgi:hypothetical protein
MTTALVNALTRFLEADEAMTRDRYVARNAPALQRKVAATFREQGRRFGASFGQFRATVDANAVREALTGSDWLPLWYETAAATALPFSESLEAALLDALLFGGGELLRSLAVDEVDLGISFDLENPRAVAWAKMHAAAQVARIDDTTRAQLNTLISQATEEGWSYTRLSDAIADRFGEFATGGPNPRSRRIAVFELGDAYEAGNEMAARELMAAGIPLEKKWLTVGDDRVRPSHRGNQNQGWIDYDDTYQSGDFRPPSDPGCRCTTLTRRKKTA